MKVGSLFSGIGGIDLGLERAGMEVIWQCEKDKFCKRVLRKHWPNVTMYDDVSDIGDSTEKVDIICGGFPCQPVSIAGKQQRQNDERWLWPDFARVIRQLRPRYVFMENVSGLLVGGMGDVLGDLAEIGYDAEWQVLPAAAFGAPHLRARVFIIAYERGERSQGFLADRAEGLSTRRVGGESAGLGYVPMLRGLDLSDSRFSRMGVSLPISRRKNRPRRLEYGPIFGSESWSPFSYPLRVANGFPNRVDRLKSIGNAVVPQVSEWIGKRIMMWDNNG